MKKLFRYSIFQLEKDEFIAHLDAMKNAFATFHQGYTDTIPLPETLSTSLKNITNLKWLICIAK